MNTYRILVVSVSLSLGLTSWVQALPLSPFFEGAPKLFKSAASSVVYAVLGGKKNKENVAKALAEDTSQSKLPTARTTRDSIRTVPTPRKSTSSTSSERKGFISRAGHGLTAMFKIDGRSKTAFSLGAFIGGIIGVAAGVAFGPGVGAAVAIGASAGLGLLFNYLKDN